MPETELERSLYNAYTTEWGGKIPKEKEFNEWKEKQIELYGKAAEKAKEIADLLERGASEEEIEKALRDDLELGKKMIMFLGEKDKTVEPGLFNVAGYFIARDILVQKLTEQGMVEQEANSEAVAILSDKNKNPQLYEAAQKDVAKLLATAKTDPVIADQLTNYKLSALAKILSTNAPTYTREFNDIFNKQKSAINIFDKIERPTVKENILVGYFASVVASSEARQTLFKQEQ